MPQKEIRREALGGGFLSVQVTERSQVSSLRDRNPRLVPYAGRLSKELRSLPVFCFFSQSDVDGEICAKSTNMSKHRVHPDSSSQTVPPSPSGRIVDGVSSLSVESYVRPEGI